MKAVVFRHVDELVPYARNARTHSAEQVARIAASIAEFGFAAPVLADDRGIVAGHGRVLAARRLYESGKTLRLPSGEEIPSGTVPVVDVTGWTDAQRRAYILADNRLAEQAGWDEELLALELSDLRDSGFDLDVTGFTLGDLDSLLGGETKPGLTDPDDVPDVEEVAVSRPGDLWLLGEHRLLCGDSTDLACVGRVLAGAVADICWTDPPWNVAYGSSQHPSYRRRSIANDDLGKEFPAFCAAFVAGIKRATKPGAALYLAMSAQEWPTIDGALRAGGFRWSSTIIWAKDSLVLGRGDYHRQYEPIWYGWNAGSARRRPLKDRKQSDLWSIPRPKKSDEHPTMKPVDLVSRALRNSSSHGDLVFEPFGGSGSTVIASEQSERRCCALELEPRYVDVIVRRWQAFTGREAILEGDGRSFAAVAGERGATAVSADRGATKAG